MGASWAAANSCVADVAKPAERGKFFGILGGAGAFGFVIGFGPWRDIRASMATACRLLPHLYWR